MSASKWVFTDVFEIPHGFSNMPWNRNDANNRLVQIIIRNSYFSKNVFIFFNHIFH